MRAGYILSAVAGALIALMAFFVRVDGAVDGIKFRLGMWDKESAKSQVAETIQSFNSYYARFFSTGGDLEGLGTFPAENMIKRRIVQEINTWTADGKALVYDKYAVEVKDVELLSPVLATATVNESWSLMLRDTSVKQRRAGTKSLNIQVRYMLGRLDDQWKVLEYYVYGPDEEMLPAPEVWLN